MNEGHSSHPARQGAVERKIALVSSCGLWEMDNFDALLSQVRLICTGMGFLYAGALLRPHSEAMSAFAGASGLAHEVLNSAREAGLELASAGVFSQRNMDAVSRPLMPMDRYIEMCNGFLQSKMTKIEASAHEAAVSRGLQAFAG